MVTENVLTTPHVGRFGWKDDHAFLRGFSGDAYLNEMGITNYGPPMANTHTHASMRQPPPGHTITPMPFGLPFVGL